LPLFVHVILNGSQVSGENPTHDQIDKSTDQRNRQVNDPGTDCQNV